MVSPRPPSPAPPPADPAAAGDRRGVELSPVGAGGDRGHPDHRRPVVRPLHRASGGISLVVGAGGDPSRHPQVQHAGRTAVLQPGGTLRPGQPGRHLAGPADSRGRTPGPLQRRDRLGAPAGAAGHTGIGPGRGGGRGRAGALGHRQHRALARPGVRLARLGSRLRRPGGRAGDQHRRPRRRGEDLPLPRGARLGGGAGPARGGLPVLRPRGESIPRRVAAGRIGAGGAGR